jgi:hypothetical protein
MPETELLALLYRVCAGFRPGPAELDGAAWVSDWAIASTVGPFAITGKIDGAPLFAVLLAVDDAEQWGLLTGGWVRLGECGGPAAWSPEVTRRAMLWLAEDSRMDAEMRPPRAAGDDPRPNETRAIGAAAILLAEQADRAGLLAASYLLRMAALEAGEEPEQA